MVSPVGNIETTTTAEAVATDGELTVVVADDEPDIAELYTTWLELDHTVRTAHGGEEALEAVDDEVDVVFLDRRMPDYTGDEVLDRIRGAGYDCRVVMVTAVDPDFDIVDMPFDDYLTKPVMRDDLVEAVRTMQERDAYDETLREYFALASKKATLETNKPHSELRRSEQYREMSERVEQLEAQADATVTDFDHEDFASVFKQFPSG